MKLDSIPILYINLDHREDRKLHVISQLNQIGFSSFERFPAVKMKYGAVGCGISHIRCLELAKERNLEMIGIVEDDFKCVDINTFRTSLNNFCEKYEKDNIIWDVLLLGANNCPPYFKPHDVEYCVQITNCQSAIGYIVKREYYDILIQNMREAIHHLIKQPDNKPQYAVDMYWKRLQTSGRWYLITPLTITQLANYSDIEEKDTNYDYLMLDINKGWLFSPQYQQSRMNEMTTIKKKMLFDT
jgi:GR25 family glycosyltransferase involved in LPS biosynthesis